MSIVNDFIEIIRQVDENIELPLIQEAYFPRSLILEKISKKSNFGAIKLEDGSIGIVNINLSPEIKEKAAKLDLNKIHGISPLELAKKFASSDQFKKTLGLGAINAISQHVFRVSDYSFDFTTDSLGLLNLKPQDKVGMVGFFPPLVKQIEQMGLTLTVIEKKKHLVKKTNKWEVTLDTTQLTSCNKIVCTSTTILNDTLDDVLKYCSDAEKISIIGPTAGFFPDPLFKRGINIIGGTFIKDSVKFMNLIRQNLRWGPSTKKYCIQKRNYLGFDSLLNQIIQK